MLMKTQFLDRVQRRCAGCFSRRAGSLHARRLSRSRRHDRHGTHHGLARRPADQPLYLPARHRPPRSQYGRHRLLDVEIRLPFGRGLRHRHHRRHERGRAGRQPALPARIGLRAAGRHAARHGTEHLDAVRTRQFRHGGRGGRRTRRRNSASTRPTFRTACSRACIWPSPILRATAPSSNTSTAGW